MAYSDYGAFVFCNGIRRPDKEDVGVFDTEEADLPSGQRIFANLSKNMARYGFASQTEEDHLQAWAAHSHHAVLGDGLVRLCGYKNYKPELWSMGSDRPLWYNLEDYITAWDTEGDAIEWSGTMLDHLFAVKVVTLRGQHGLALRLVEPGGAQWTAEAGYLFGAGHLPDDQATEAKHWWLPGFTGSHRPRRDRD
jgi:hypothetical protein